MGQDRAGLAVDQVETAPLCALDSLPAAPAFHAAQHKTCPVCSGARLEPRFVVSGFHLVRCRDCSLLFVGEQLGPDELQPYYDLSVEDFVYATPDNVENLKFYYRRLKELLEARIAPGRLLDVGCGRGYFLDIMEGWERHGLEWSSAIGEVARHNYGERIFLGSIENYDAPDMSFDCITLQDVLDHTPNPLNVLRKCNRLLRPGGLLVIKVHDVSCLYARLTGRRFYAIIPPYHLFYFSRHTLEGALARAGFQPLLVKHLGHLLWLKTVCYRLARNNRKSLWYQLFKVLDRSRLGRIRIYKNLHDIVTIISSKNIESV
jgi:SAM-dependent methyltransferase